MARSPHLDYLEDLRVRLKNKPEAVRTQMVSDSAPLIAAISNNDRKMFHSLVSLGINPNTMAAAGLPLSLAVRLEKTWFVDQLCALGARWCPAGVPLIQTPFYFLISSHSPSPEHLEQSTAEIEKLKKIPEGILDLVLEQPSCFDRLLKAGASFSSPKAGAKKLCALASEASHEQVIALIEKITHLQGKATLQYRRGAQLRRAWKMDWEEMAVSASELKSSVLLDWVVTCRPALSGLAMATQLTRNSSIGLDRIEGWLRNGGSAHASDLQGNGLLLTTYDQMSRPKCDARWSALFDDLLEAGANPAQANNNGSSVLSLAAKSGDLAQINARIERVRLSKVTPSANQLSSEPLAVRRPARL